MLILPRDTIGVLINFQKVCPFATGQDMATNVPKVHSRDGRINGTRPWPMREW
jgi:hypothetical protein